MFRKWTVDPPGKDQLGDVRLMASAGARLLTESGYRADFSEESLIDADAYLDTLGNPEDQNTLIVAFGCYLGETLCRVLGAHWAFDANNPRRLEVRTAQESRCWPVEFVAKKFGSDGDFKSMATLLRALRSTEAKARDVEDD